jgi:acyl carrier protein
MTDTNNEAHIQSTLRNYVESTFLVKLDGAPLSASSNLFEAGVIDSYGVVEMVSFIERELGVKLTDDELLSPELSSVAGMTALVSRKKRAA